MQGIDRRWATHHSTLTVAAHSMPDSLFLPILQLLQTTPWLTQYLACNHQTLCVTQKRHSRLPYTKTQPVTALAQAQLLAIEPGSRHVALGTRSCSLRVSAIHEQYDKHHLQKCFCSMLTLLVLLQDLVWGHPEADCTHFA